MTEMTKFEYTVGGFKGEQVINTSSALEYNRAILHFLKFVDMDSLRATSIKENQNETN